MAPGSGASDSYNVHTGLGEFGASMSIGDISDLETIEAANGQVSFGGASLADVNVLASRAVNTGALVATSVNTGSLEVDTLVTRLARIAAATVAELTAAVAKVAALTSDVATIADLTVTTLRLQLLRVRDFVVEQVATVLTLNVTGDATVAGSLKAGNIIHEVNNLVYGDIDGNWTWTHAALKEPVVYVVTALNNRPLATKVSLDQQTATSVRCHMYNDTVFGPSYDTDRNELHLLAIGS
jgi:hypothetical protein